MAKMNWDKTRKFREYKQLELKLFKPNPASENQKQFLRALGVPFENSISKKDAHLLISHSLEQQKLLTKTINSRISRDR